MAKRTIEFRQGCYYHIFNRGARRRSIFLDDTDYQRALLSLEHYSCRYQFAVIAYCFLPNHYHWLVRQDGTVATRVLPQFVFNSYVKAFNARHHHTGTLFEGPFEAKLVDSEAYLRNLCCYIHVNPVHHALAAAPDLWPYSNYLDWIGQRPGTLLDTAFVAAHFSRPQSYRSFVEEHLAGRHRIPDDLRWYLDHLEIGLPRE